MRHDPRRRPPTRTRARPPCTPHRPFTPRPLSRAGRRSTSQAYSDTRRNTLEPRDKSHDAASARSPYYVPRARPPRRVWMAEEKGGASCGHLRTRINGHPRAASSQGAIRLRCLRLRALQLPWNASGMRGSRLLRRSRARGRGIRRTGKKWVRRLRAVIQRASFGDGWVAVVVRLLLLPSVRRVRNLRSVSRLRLRWMCFVLTRWLLYHTQRIDVYSLDTVRELANSVP